MNRYWSLAILLAGAAGWYYQHQETPTPQHPSSPAQAPQTIRLPSKPVRGLSSTWTIYSSGNEGATTAAGQIFTPPAEAPTLTRLGFKFDQSYHGQLQPEVSFQIILSEWEFDRPSSTEVWASEIRTLPSPTETVKYGWQNFNVPSIKLDANKEYIAWITLSELGNPPGVHVGVPDMGPSYRTSPTADPNAKPIHNYKQGRSAFFRVANPGGSRQSMTGYAWEVRNPGQNLFFRMFFEVTP